jgi:hypothetical protein
MPDLKITQFSQIVTLDDTDVLAIVDLTDNTTKKVTVAQLKALATFISLTTTGTSGAATLIGGVLNVPQYQVTSVGYDRYVLTGFPDYYYQYTDCKCYKYQRQQR